MRSSGRGGGYSADADGGEGGSLPRCRGGRGAGGGREGCPGSAAFNIASSESLKALARGPDEESITVVQPDGDKGGDEPLSRTAQMSCFFMTEVKEGSPEAVEM